jgi:hypothetical protein
MGNAIDEIECGFIHFLAPLSAGRSCPKWHQALTPRYIGMNIMTIIGQPAQDLPLH